jgi:hypothetical protein
MLEHGLTVSEYGSRHSTEAPVISPAYRKLRGLAKA